MKQYYKSKKQGRYVPEWVREQKRSKKLVKDDVNNIYAVLAIALYELLDIKDSDKKQDFINAVFARSQDIWIGAAEEGKTVDDIMRMCTERTGLEI